MGFKITINDGIISENSGLHICKSTSTAKCLSKFRFTKSSGLGLFNPATEPLQCFQSLVTT